MAGPLSFMSNQDEEGPQITSSFMPTSVAMPQPGGMASSERLSQIKEEVAPDEGPSVADTIKEARMRLINQTTGGVNPFVAWLSAKSRGGRDKYANAADAMNQAYAQRDASEEAKNLKLLNYSIEEAKAKNEEDRYQKEDAYKQAVLKAKEPKSPDLYYKVGTDGKQYGPFNVNDPEEYKKFSDTPGKPFKVGTEPVPKNDAGPKNKGFDASGNLVTDENLTDLVYSPEAFGKAKLALRANVDAIAGTKKTLDLLDENPSAFSNWKTIQAGLPPMLQGFVPEENKLSESDREIRARVFSQASAYIKNLYGVAVSGREKEMLQQFLPTPKDNLDSLIGKLKSAYQISLEGIGNVDSEMLKKAESKNLDYVLELAANPYGKKEKTIPQMTGNASKDKATWDSLNPGDPYTDAAGKPRTK